MYIKQIIIQGFKSYKEQTVIEPFSPKHNVIVGRNGSGKSNFFAAIRFVLSDAYTQMGREERSALLHEGTGSAVMSAFVEIIFDNSDDRFPTGKPELILRRTIGMKKDEYSLDRKNATKSDVMNLLESAGFSRSNPYYIVPQGRVTALTNMKDAERLNLLKEVAGTQVYEARRTESLKIMTETNNKREKIDELLNFIKERLTELEEEKEELRDYQEKDKDRRCLQYSIDYREQVAINEELDKINDQRQTGVDDTDEHQQRFVQGEKKLAEINSKIGELKQQVEFLKVDKKQLDDERREAAKSKAKIELEVKDLSDGQSAAQEAKAQHTSDLQSLNNTIKEHDAELAEIIPEYKSRQAQETTAKSELDNAEGIRRRLYSKQGRNVDFRNKRERDDWLRNEINKGYPELAKNKAVRVQTTEDIAQLEIDIASVENELVALREQMDSRGESTEAMQKEIDAAKAERDKLMDERKELWREDAKLDSVISNAQSELRRAEQNLSHTMDQNTSRGLAAVRRIKRQHNLDGVYGTLAELLEVNDRFRRAVEVTAGNSLFHYVVDNDETATKVIEILQREKAGRITFIPLNRVRSRTGNVPKANDAVPMVEKIQFDPIYEKAFQQVFGQTIICPSLAIAGQYARSHGVNGVTLEGDRSDKKGAFTGGSIDTRHSRLQAVRDVSKWRDECDAHRNRSAEIKRTLEKKDQEITRAVGELQKLEQKRTQQENSYGPLRQEIRGKSSSLQKLKDTFDEKERAKVKIEANMRTLTEQQNAYEAEIAVEFEKALTRDEETQLENLSSTVQDLRRQYKEASSARSELEPRKTKLEIELRENLRPRLDQLKAQEFDNGVSGSGGNLSHSQKELKSIEKTLATIEQKLQETETSIDFANASIADLQAHHASTLTSQSEIAKTIEKSQKRMEKSIQKRRILTKQAAECLIKIRDLGILPTGALEKYQKVKSEEIVKRLHKVNEALKKYGHVNKKAFEQYNNFTAQRDLLEKRRAELDSSQASIEDLISVLDQRKDEAIERTFKQVSREFANVFEKLVPAGRGRLVIQRKADRGAQEDEDSDDEARRESVENYTGVGISVSFNSKHDDQQRIQQLSGGQKSLCALALVFAIQQCDPAPFYLFDEIDANLDAQYRTAVANMLRDISNQSEKDGEGLTSGQFICTTFRPEMLLVAEKTYGVRYQRNKSSSVVVVSKEEALSFVEGEKQ
ncbi:MAG: Structural maintenance of chromosomes protein 3 [Heterodermia speciosa]|uniref:Structural maintenance of chromosomes protein n=1 Tax=Heterodermia speciosa TaxID=116794 RepID=A0A8H3I3G7_9LECA|nr:MAG: Structural maintenance of chromosomes protein 3 [Heterodermia speciosa]